MEMLKALGETPYAEWVKESWGWAAALTVHAFGNAIIVGLVFIIGLAFALSRDKKRIRWATASGH